MARFIETVVVLSIVLFYNAGESSIARANSTDTDTDTGTDTDTNRTTNNEPNEFDLAVQRMDSDQVITRMILSEWLRTNGSNTTSVKSNVTQEDVVTMSERQGSHHNRGRHENHRGGHRPSRGRNNRRNHRGHNHGHNNQHHNNNNHGRRRGNRGGGHGHRRHRRDAIPDIDAIDGNLFRKSNFSETLVSIKEEGKPLVQEIKEI